MRRGLAIAIAALRIHALANIFVCLFAVLLCLVNAVVWTLVSEMPMMGIAWLLAAFGCIALQKWTRG